MTERTPRRLLFVGPSLPDAAALTAGTSVSVLPPVAAGDLLRLPLDAGDTVGIVDGFFHQVGAVRHKEILLLLDRGVRVLGAASMGALRAAELGASGMRGIGGIYADYRDGRLLADDEVTLLHSTAQEGYRALSEPLVCMRATLDAAVRAGACAPATAAQLIELLAARPFGLRSYDALLAIGQDVGLTPSARRELRDHCLGHRVDPKRADALLLVDALLADAPRSTRPHGPATAQPAQRMRRTSFVHAWQLAARGADTPSGRVSDLGLLRACQLFATDYPRFHRDLVLGAIARECAEQCGPADAATVAQAAVRHGEHRGFYTRPLDRVRLPFLDQWLTRAERDTLTVDDQLVSFLVRSFRVTPGMMGDEPAMDALRGSPGWHRARGVVELAWHLNDRTLADDPERDLGSLSQRRILDHMAQRWAVDRDELDMAAMDRGIEPTGLAAVARAFYLLDRYNPAATRLTLAQEQPDGEALMERT